MKKIYPLLLFMLMMLQLEAQQQKSKYAKLKFNKSNKEKDIFLKKQWWLGVKAGGNLTNPVVTKSYTIIAPTNYPATESQKKYTKYKNLAAQLSLEATFYYRGFNFSFQPTYRNVRFNYSNEYEWISSVESRTFSMDYLQKQHAEYLDLPWVIKYENGPGRLRPYVQGGIYTSHLINATKNVLITKTDYASGSPNEIKDEPILVGASDLFAKNQWGLLAGVGVNYNIGNVRLNLDFQYKKGMSNASSTKNRFSNDRLSGVGDTFDDLRLNNLSLSFGCLFPLRFLEKDYKSLDKK